MRGSVFLLTSAWEAAAPLFFPKQSKARGTNLSWRGLRLLTKEPRDQRERFVDKDSELIS